jgi:hypothetical protein
MPGGGTEAQLMEFFTKAVHAFNEHLDLTQYLDANATVYSVSHKIAHHPRFIANAYLMKQYEDDPSFTLDSFTVAVNAAGTGAIIQGKTTWTDNNKLGGEQLIFSCTLVHDQAKGWLFSTLWAS